MQIIKPITLGALIDYLEGQDHNLIVPLSLDWDSYRGYYEHVAIAPGESRAGSLADVLREAIGGTMYGYKGGDYLVEESCRVFVAEYGCSGPALGLDRQSELVLIESTHGW